MHNPTKPPRFGLIPPPPPPPSLRSAKEISQVRKDSMEKFWKDAYIAAIRCGKTFPPVTAKEAIRDFDFQFPDH